MSTFLLLKHYSGDGAPMPEWTPAEITAHIRFQHELVASWPRPASWCGRTGSPVRISPRS